MLSLTRDSFPPECVIRAEKSPVKGFDFVLKSRGVRDFILFSHVTKDELRKCSGFVLVPMQCNQGRSWIFGSREIVTGHLSPPVRDRTRVINKTGQKNHKSGIFFILTTDDPQFGSSFLKTSYKRRKKVVPRFIYKMT